MEHLFLDLDRTKPVFSLLFSFIRDDACCDSTGEDFEEALQDVLLGQRLPQDIKDCLRPIYMESQTEPHELRDLASETVRLLENQRETLIALLSVLLRLSVNDGIVCRSAKSRFLTIVRVFGLRRDEIKLFSDEAKEILEIILGDYGRDKTQKRRMHLDAHYVTLGCRPECSDAELRSAFRKRAKEFHPDTSTGSGRSEQKFLELINAFEEVTKARKTDARVE